MNKEKEMEVRFELEVEKRKFIVNIMGFFFAIIPTMINFLDKFWVNVDPQISIPINSLGVFTIGGQLTSCLDKTLKEIPLTPKVNKVVFYLNIVFIVIYSAYVVIVPVCYFIGIDNVYITIFSYAALLIRAGQSFIEMLGNLGMIRRLAKKLK